MGFIKVWGMVERDRSMGSGLGKDWLWWQWGRGGLAGAGIPFDGLGLGF